MSAFLAVFLREMLLLKRRFKRLLGGMAVSPILYLLTFGCALGDGMRVDGRSYIEFLLPGLAAMASMTQAFAMATEINIARFYSRVFEEIQSAPVGRAVYVLGEVCAGVARVVLACLVVLVLGLFFGVRLHCGSGFWLAILLNAFAFASLAVALAMLVKSHADQALLNTFVITPMAFLGGTFFPLEKLPEWAQGLLYLLPLTHASRAVRAAALGDGAGWAPYAALAAAGAVFFAFAVYAVGKARD